MLEFMDIDDLIELTYLPFEEVEDFEIEEAIYFKDFIRKPLIYSGLQLMSLKTKTVKKIATIANEIKNKTYDYQFPIFIWKNELETELQLEIWDMFLFHVRAFYYCRQKIPVKFFTGDL